MKRYFQALAISAALVVPVVASAQDHDHATESRKYEDKAHKDSHEWNTGEDAAYRRYLEAHHRKYHEFDKAKKSEQNDYWNWRHSHPDNDHR